jgi:Tol biopolymer transport system component
MSTEVFISYSSQDYERVMPLVDRLRAAGVDVWVDEGNIDAATLWSESIVEAIAECHVLIMMVSSHSTDSHNVVKEVMIASESKKTILPIYLETADIPAKLKYQLTGIQHLEWFDGGSDEVFETLKDGLAKRGVTVDGQVPDKQANQALGQAPQKQTRRPHRPPTSQPPTSKSKNIALATLTIVCALLLGQIFLNSQTKENTTTNKQPIYLPVSVPEGEKFYFDLSSQFHQSIAISPDGNWIAYVSGTKADGNHTLWLHSIKDDTKTKLATSQSMWGIYDPFFSPDSRWLAIFDDGKLKRYSTDTHEMNVICDESVTFGGVWGDDGNIYFSPYEGSQLQSIKINSSSDPETIISQAILNESKSKDVVGSFSRIAYLPDGQGILFSDFHPITTADNGSIVYLDLKTKKLTPLLKNGFAPKYSKTGHIVYIRDNTLKAREFDIKSLRVGLDEVTLISGIRTNPFWGNAQFSISHNGDLVFIPGTNITRGQFAWVDRNGEIERLNIKPAAYSRFNLNSTGDKIAVAISGERPDIEVLDIDKGSSTKLTTKGINWWPVWSPDDSKIVFARSKKQDRSHDVIQTNSSGASSEQLIYSSKSSMAPDDWSKDGEKIAVVQFPIKTGYLNLASDPVEFKELTSSQGSSIFGFKFSPNGKWISFSSSIAGGYNCYIAPIDKPNEAYLISNIYQGEEPIWSPNGNEIFYRAPQGMYSVPLEFDENGSVEIGQATLLFSTPWIDNPGIGHEIHPSGEKFLVVVHEEEEVSDHFKIVFNFDALIEQKFAELKMNKQP